jgi:hypothetical protein
MRASFGLNWGWCWFLALLAAVGCGGQGGELAFPAAIGGWQLKPGVASTMEEAWPEARNHGLQALQVASYQGNGDPRAFAHRMATSGGAFETMQHWRAESGAAAFQYGIFFVVVRSPALSQSELNRFAAGLKAGFSPK